MPVVVVVGEWVTSLLIAWKFQSCPFFPFEPPGTAINMNVIGLAGFPGDSLDRWPGHTVMTFPAKDRMQIPFWSGDSNLFNPLL